MSNRKSFVHQSRSLQNLDPTATKQEIHKTGRPVQAESNCHGERAILASKKSSSHGHQSIDGGKSKEASSSQIQKSTLADVTASGYTRYSLLRTTKPETVKPRGTASKPEINKLQGHGNEESNCHGQRSILASVLVPGYAEKSNSHGHQSIDRGKSKEASSSQGERSTLADATAPGYTRSSLRRTTKTEIVTPQGTGRQWSSGRTSKEASESQRQRSTSAYALAPGYTQKFAKP